MIFIHTLKWNGGLHLGKIYCTQHTWKCADPFPYCAEQVKIEYLILYNLAAEEGTSNITTQDILHFWAVIISQNVMKLYVLQVTQSLLI